MCHSMLALIKGMLACTTIVPDSIGWDACKTRLPTFIVADFNVKPQGINKPIYANSKP